MSSFGFEGGKFISAEDIDTSILAIIGNFIAPVFAPLGFGNWKAAVATIMGLVAKEEVVGVFGVLSGSSGDLWEGVGSLSAYSFLIFNLLCAPCFAAMGAIKREMNSARWTMFAILYQTLFAYIISFTAYQICLAATSDVFTIEAALAFVIILAIIYMLFRSKKGNGPSCHGGCKGCEASKSCGVKLYK